MQKSFESLDYYDEQGNPKSFFLFWVTTFIIARSWLLFVIAGASKKQGSILLELFYPHNSTLYLALLVSFPVILLMLFAGGLHKLPSIALHYWHFGKWIILAVLCGDLFLQIKMQAEMHWQFHFASAITLVSSCWLFVYVLRSQRLAWFFKIE